MGFFKQLRDEVHRTSAPDESLWTVQALRENRERRRWWTRSLGPPADKAYAIVCVIGAALAIVAVVSLGGGSIL